MNEKEVREIIRRDGRITNLSRDESEQLGVADGYLEAREKARVLEEALEWIEDEWYGEYATDARRKAKEALAKFRETI